MLTFVKEYLALFMPSKTLFPLGYPVYSPEPGAGNSMMKVFLLVVNHQILAINS